MSFRKVPCVGVGLLMFCEEMGSVTSMKGIGGVWGCGKMGMLGMLVHSGSDDGQWQGRQRKRRRINIELNEDELDEQFILGSGKGGQKVNKTSSSVRLTHLPTGIFVKCQAERSQRDNRRIARKRLMMKLDEHFNGTESKVAKKAAKKRKQKQRRRRRTMAKLDDEVG
eukprot:TRINITY_DN1896_c1_g1_i1.p1 TRINITY_DN1896_c1_g1~~TRINITY_DN1896_c1_g1_i1.p1  ORF type:complete len:168 (-),score=42.02 TRINITY_DN1896_c1_g1_i1:118-621(-)